MASLYGIPERPTPKHYRSYFSSFQDQLDALKDSTTVYVGNLAFTTPEDRIQDLFRRCGVVQRVVMGLNRFDLTQCGFCFVIFDTHEAAQYAVDYLSGLKDGLGIQ
ncbi:hypothetical protein WA588_000548 [Blastocystis sp. NMH]